MQKIMFNDKCSLTKAVIELFKEMTRREPIFEELKNPRFEFDTKGHLCLYDGDVLVHKSRYALNEEVAVAQSYKDCGYDGDTKCGWCYDENEEQTDVFYKDVSGWKNKMFVKSSRMPHAIRITDIKVERLQDISDEDCLREGIIPKKLEYTPAGYPKGLTYYGFDGWGIVSDYAKDAFATLIDKVSGRGTWERNP